jgi:hypothetical protein
VHARARRGKAPEEPELFGDDLDDLDLEATVDGIDLSAVRGARCPA